MLCNSTPCNIGPHTFALPLPFIKAFWKIGARPRQQGGSIMGLRWSLALAMALLVLASCSQAVPDIKSRCTACKCIADQLRVSTAMQLTFRHTYSPGLHG